MDRAPHQVAIDVLGPVLAEIGYTQVRETRRKGGLPFSSEFVNPTADEMTHKPHCTLFATDAYPNDRGEAFLCVFNWIGMVGPVKAVAEHLTRRGIPARATTHNKLRGVRFKFDPWAIEDAARALRVEAELGEDQ